MADLFNPPQAFDLPLSKGGDLYVDFIHKPLVVDGDGNPVLDSSGNRQYEVADYPNGATVRLVIDTDEPVIVEADIDDEHAIVWEQSEVADTIPRGKLWRAVVTYSNGLDVVMCNGVTVRKDGK